MAHPQWLDWAQRLQALAQSGLAYSPNIYDRERYEIIRSIAVEMLSAAAGIELPQVKELIDAQAGYATPKIDIRGVVFQEGKILLVRELADGGWTLPGGWVDVNEPPSRAVEREVWEESGYQVRANKLLAVYDRNQHGHPPYIFHTYKLYVRCELTGGQPVDSHETDGARFFGADDLPPLSTARTTPEVLARMFAHYDHPHWPTDFD
jgi:ADP-ribose pyrophosphatase YjhB (NUDIX family)